MIKQGDMTSLINQVKSCSLSHPLSGCIFSDLKDKQKAEIKNHLNDLSDKAFNRILSYHDSCPFKNRLAF